MCGIVGIITYKEPIDEKLLIDMRDTLIHRGPDDEGIWISSDKKVYLGHRRLSIIDLSIAGHQPMSDEEKKIWIVYNGEIYNFQEIRQELEKRGYMFKSNTDTEVIIYSYKEWDIDCLQKFNGMFAFGIWDENKKLLFLARDRVGKKPLYIAKYKDKFVFASEIKAILKDKDFSREIDINALNFYFAYGYIPGEMCIFKNIKKLPPAHYGIIDINGELKIKRYWNIPNPVINEKISEKELLLELEDLLTDSVKKRIVSDVPLGVFLSGGIDSSLITAVMSKILDSPVKTFSIGFKEEHFNELPYARIVAKYFNTEHYEFTVEPDSVGILDILSKQFDEPFGDSSMIPTFYVSKMTKQYVTVALSGDGGDELFGGYNNYPVVLRDNKIIKYIPYPLRKLMSNFSYLLPDGIRVEGFLKRLKCDFKENFADRHSIFRSFQRKKLLNREIISILGENLILPEQYRIGSVLGRTLRDLTISDFHIYLPDDILVKVDRASMLNSLEVRAPFLDYRIIEFSYSKVPDNFKLNGNTKKYLLKKLAKKILPQDLKLERKRGFSIPINEWFHKGWRNIYENLIYDISDEFINKNYAVRLLKLNDAKLGNHSARMFLIMMYLLWRKNYL